MIRPELGKHVGFKIVYNHSSGGVVWQHELVDVRMIDYFDILEIATDKAQLGREVHILPTLPEGHPLRKIVFENAKERKCPDLRVDGRYTEIKTPIDKLHQQKISHSIKLAAAQADDVIIRLTTYFDASALAGIAKGRFFVHRTLNLVEFKLQNDYYSFNRSDFL